MRSPLTLSLAAGALLLPAALLSWLSPPRAEAESAPPNRYIGAQACKNCHQDEAKGNQYGIWHDSQHAKAFEVLGTEEAKKVAAERGIEDPQKADECLQCHVTAHGADKKEIKKGFEAEMGVQCETCHGPGEDHAKKRLMAAMSGKADPSKLQQIPADEIVSQPKLEVCLDCHNEKSPTFKPFCFKERNAEISHLDPRKERTEEEMAARKCTCAEHTETCQCVQGECGTYEPGHYDPEKSSPADADADKDGD